MVCAKIEREGVRKMFEWRKGVFFLMQKASVTSIHPPDAPGGKRVYDVGTSSSRTQENVRYAPRSKPLTGLLLASADR